MQVVSLAPVPVASMVWRHGDDPWTLSVVCKITVRLEPGTALLAKSHDPIHDRDVGGSQAAGTVHAPADLIPLRTAVDVTLVGDAFGYGVAGPASARLVVGDIDRQLLVDPAGSSCPAPPEFAPLAADHERRRALLGKLARPERSLDSMSLPVGFNLDYFSAAPVEQQLDELDADALLRLEHLHPDHHIFETRLPNVSPQVFVQREGRRQERPTVIDALWIDSRRALATITWRCLIPLATKEEPGRVWVTVAGPGRRMSSAQLSDLIRELGGRDEPSDDLSLIDDDDDPMNRTVAIPVRRPPPTRGLRQPKPPADAISVAPAEPSAMQASGRHTSATALGMVEGTPSDEPAWLKRERRAAEGTERSGSASVLPPPRPPPSRQGLASPWSDPGMPLPPLRDDRLEDTASLPAGHAALAQQSMAAAASSLHAAASLGAAVSSSGVGLLPLDGLPPGPGSISPAAASPAAASPASTASSSASPSSASPSSASLSSTSPSSASLSSTSPSSALLLDAPPAALPPELAVPPASLLQSKLASASAASVNLGAAARPAPASTEAERPGAQRRPLRRRAVRPLDMLWFDGNATQKLRKRWQELCTELDFAPPDRIHDLPTDDPQLARDHHTHFGVLAQVEPVDRGGLRALMQQSVAEDGRFTPPLCALDGELKVSFDPIVGLRALVGAMKPFTTDDRKLEAAIEDVTVLLDDAASTSQTLRSGRRHLREVFKSSKRSTTLDVLDQAVERTLLEQRKYDMRTLLGGNWIRATLKWGKSDVVCYLSEELATRLPMMMSFEARVVAEAHLRQDQFEGAPYALRVMTLGRFVKL